MKGFDSKIILFTLIIPILALCSSCSAWEKWERDAYPQNPKDLKVLKEIAQPFGINLNSPDALQLLKRAGKINLKSDGKNFTSFMGLVQRSHPQFKEVERLVEFTGAANREDKPMGFMFYDFKVGEKLLTGRKYYYDKDYNLCTNFLFAERPLSSAEFIMVIFNKRSSRLMTKKDAYLCIFAKKGSKAYGGFADL